MIETFFTIIDAKQNMPVASFYRSLIYYCRRRRGRVRVRRRTRRLTAVWLLFWPLLAPEKVQKPALTSTRFKNIFRQ